MPDGFAAARPAAPSPPSRQAAPAPRPLAAGRAVEAELNGGESHVYEVRLEAGQYVQFVVEQKGVDALVTLLSPAGEKLAEVDAPTGEYGPEHLSHVTAGAGTYRLSVSALAKDAPKGRYAASLEAPRAATEADRKRVAAERLYNEGQALSLARTPEGIREAVAKFEQARELLRSAADPRAEAEVVSALAVMHFNLGDKARAVELLEQEAPLRRAAGDRKGLAVTFNSRGIIAHQAGDYQQALEQFERALAVYVEVGDRYEESNTLNNLGLVYQMLGDTEKALDAHARALPLRRATNNRTGEVATLHNLGLSYDRLGDWAKALELYRQSAALARQLERPEQEAVTLTNIAGLLAANGDPREAIEQIKRAIELRRERVDSRENGYAYNELAVAHEKLGDAAAARENFARSLDLLRAAGDPAGQARVLANLARFELRGGGLDAALRHTEEALGIIELTRARVASPALRGSYLASVRDFYELYVEVLMRLHARDAAAGYDARALHASERARARGLLELLAEARADIRRGVDPRLLEGEEEARRKLLVKAAAQSRLLAAGEQGDKLAALTREVAELARERERAEARIREASPRYAALAQPAPLGLADIQQLLDADTLLLEFALGAERSFLWAVTRDSLASHELPRGAEVEAAARRFYELLSARNQTPAGESAEQYARRVAAADEQLGEAGAALSRMLLAPVAGRLGGRRLVVVADGALQYVPFSALPFPRAAGAKTAQADYLINTNEVVSLPSASVLAQLRRAAGGRRPAPKTLAVIADPVFSEGDPRVRAARARLEGKGRETRAGAASQQSGDAASRQPGAGGHSTGGRALTRSAAEVISTGGGIPRLPFTRREAESIFSLVPAGEGLKAVDFSASRAGVTGGSLAQYRVVHFATHGLLNSRHPELSGVVLSLVDESGRPSDGFLRLSDIYGMNLPADLVVLSACQTALGKEIRGEGMVGLTRGFMYAGASRVAASLWRVDDAGTAELMSRFYRGMLKDKLSPAEALRAAKSAMLNQPRWRSPYYWAAFELQGDWR